MTGDVEISPGLYLVMLIVLAIAAWIGLQIQQRAMHKMQDEMDRIRANDQRLRELDKLGEHALKNP